MKSNNQGFTLIELCVVTCMIGVLAAIAIPAFVEYRARALDTDSKSHLHNIYLACKGYWIDKGSASDCNISIASDPKYGYTPTTNISISASGGETNFSGSASHVDSINSFTIDSQGNITSAALVDFVNDSKGKSKKGKPKKGKSSGKLAKG